MNLPTLRSTLFSALVVAAGFSTAAQAQTVMDTLLHTPNVSTAAKLLQDAGLADSLNGAGPVTFFAPNNEAFNALPAEKLAELKANKDMLKAVLNFHIVPETVALESVTNGMHKTATGDSVSLYKAGTFLTIESAVVTQADLKSSNGMVQVIDTVLTPPAKK
jgi:uncharacterized surface protein with fasciclin (FAS1) repeats